MNNVVDRVPTEVLSNGAVRWEQFDSSGNSLGYVYMKRADEPAVAGTPINKVLFDSIKTDLTNLDYNKVSTSDIVRGTFAWKKDSSTTLTLNFVPSLVIINSDWFESTLGQTEGSSISAFIMSNVGNVFKAHTYNSSYSLEYLSSYTYKEPITVSGARGIIHIPALEVVTGSVYSLSDISANYIAFK